MHHQPADLLYFVPQMPWGSLHRKDRPWTWRPFSEAPVGPAGACPFCRNGPPAGGHASSRGYSCSTRTRQKKTRGDVLQFIHNFGALVPGGLNQDFSFT